jgi:hypothetical protein
LAAYHATSDERRWKRLFLHAKYGMTSTKCKLECIQTKTNSMLFYIAFIYRTEAAVFIFIQ